MIALGSRPSPLILTTPDELASAQQLIEHVAATRREEILRLVNDVLRTGMPLHDVVVVVLDPTPSMPSILPMRRAKAIEFCAKMGLEASKTFLDSSAPREPHSCDVVAISRGRVANGSMKLR